MQCVMLHNFNGDTQKGSLYFVLSVQSKALYQVGGILEILQPDKVLLDTARADEAIEDTDTTRLVVRTTCPGSAEWLLPDDGAGALLVIIHVSCCVAKSICCGEECMAVGSEA